MIAEDLLAEVARRASRYLESVKNRRVPPLHEDISRLVELGGALPEEPCDPETVIALLDTIGSPATVTSTGGRYFGFVTGGTLPAALAANWLAGAWDQNAGLWVMSPVSSKIEEIAGAWLREIFGLPPSCGVGFVTGATMANFTGLAAARHALLKRAGWDVEEQGLFGAPEIRVVLGAEAHVSVKKALSLLGLGRARMTIVASDHEGRMKHDAMPPLDNRTIICIQAGNVNTGGFDPAAEICSRARRAGAWVHVDGAFGLWAAAAPLRAHLMKGVCEADSWATDCHKWLNVPYDSGLAFVRNPQDLSDAMAVSAAYLQTSNTREPAYFTPEASRRARGVEVWAALRSLGRRGLAEMVERNCRLAARFAERLREAGYTVLNDVVLNQVMVSFGDAETTRRVIAEVQDDGTCWCGGTEWQGHAAMRISVSCWATTEEDVDRSVEAIVRIARK
ncbi:MAG TPA: aminotransferase class V-fold PLP-dependent enzyme [Candidatus Acidoferrales bacterium]|nr:aminotransferase class V-fold PLP-dependent enzyme [Candidatus Acidoferrales bacterium]